MIADRCPTCKLFWARGDGSSPLRVTAIYDRESDAIIGIRCSRCASPFPGSYNIRETLLLFRGTVLERTEAGDVSYPASIHHVCGLPGLYKAPLAAAARIVSILDPDERPPFELLDHQDRTLTLRFDDVVRDGGGFVLPTPEHVENLLEFDRGAKPGDRLVVHCHAGLSRSTAAFVALLAQRTPGAEAAAFAELRAVRPRSWPNFLIIAYADDILGTGGALARELVDHRKLMAERYPDLWHQAKLTGHDRVVK
jgi:predicted protein tyrosine phosphatase